MHRLSAWLFLVLALVAGLNPVRGFVVCIEEDGCVRVELKRAGVACRGCEDHRSTDETSTPSVESGDSGACTDVPIPQTPDEQFRTSHSIALPAPLAWLDTPPRDRNRAAKLTVERGRVCPRSRPRAAETLERIRAVVLHI